MGQFQLIFSRPDKYHCRGSLYHHYYFIVGFLLASMPFLIVRPFNRHSLRNNAKATYVSSMDQTLVGFLSHRSLFLLYFTLSSFVSVSLFLFLILFTSLGSCCANLVQVHTNVQLVSLSWKHLFIFPNRCFVFISYDDQTFQPLQRKKCVKNSEKLIT